MKKIILSFLLVTGVLHVSAKDCDTKPKLKLLMAHVEEAKGEYFSILLACGFEDQKAYQSENFSTFCEKDKQGKKQEAYEGLLPLQTLMRDTFADIKSEEELTCDDLDQVTAEALKIVIGIKRFYGSSESDSYGK